MAHWPTFPHLAAHSALPKSPRIVSCPHYRWHISRIGTKNWTTKNSTVVRLQEHRCLRSNYANTAVSFADHQCPTHSTWIRAIEHFWYWSPVNNDQHWNLKTKVSYLGGRDMGDVFGGQLFQDSRLSSLPQGVYHKIRKLRRRKVLLLTLSNPRSKIRSSRLGVDLNFFNKANNPFENRERERKRSWRTKELFLHLPLSTNWINEAE